MSRPGVLFDVDGTLVDNSYLHTLAWARAFADIDETVVTAEIHRRIGLGSSLLVEQLLGRRDEDVVERYMRHMERLEPDGHPFPQARELLEEIARRGGAVVLASSMLPEQADRRLEQIGAGDAVAGVVHSGDVEEAKPAPELWLTAMESHGLDPKRSVAVGDAVWDVISAGKAGLSTVGLECGGISEPELLAAGAVTVYKDPAHLLAELDGSPIGDLLT
jgi:HAD superfamily hydrolase (TIGR01509 family)